MRLLADECVDGRIVQELRESGLDVITVGEIAGGATDLEVVAIAAERALVLLTQDKGISDLAVRHGKTEHGLILLRDVRTDRPAVQTLLLELLAARWQGLGWTMVTIDRHRARSRVIARIFRVDRNR